MSSKTLNDSTTHTFNSLQPYDAICSTWLSFLKVNYILSAESQLRVWLSPARFSITLNKKLFREVWTLKGNCTDIASYEWGPFTESCSVDIAVQTVARVPFCPVVVCSAGLSWWFVVPSTSSAILSALWLPSVHPTSCKAIRKQREEGCSEALLWKCTHRWKLQAVFFWFPFSTWTQKTPLAD